MTRCANHAGVVMLWWAFDESYEHSRETGHATRVTVGGAIGSCEQWLALEWAWRRVLADADIPEFHMTDFEAWTPPFDFRLQDGSRDKDKHNRLLSSLLGIMEENLNHFFGVSRELEVGEANETEAYQLCVDDIIAELARYKHKTFKDRFAMIFARRKGWRLDLVEDAIEREGADKFGPIMIDRPKDVCALQAADIIAYETARVQRSGRSERYPFLRLRDATIRSGGTFSLAVR